MPDWIEDFSQALDRRDDECLERLASKISTLSARRQLAVRQALALLLSHPQPDRRWWAVRCFSELPGETALQYLLEALDDPEASVRQCALLALRFRPDPLAVPDLVEFLQDPDPLAAQLAVHALVAAGPPAVEPLLAALPQLPPSARLLAVRALAELRDPRAIPALFAALDSDSMLVEYWANEGLERLGVGMAFFAP